MGLVLVTLVLAVVVGWASGGRLGRLGDLPYHGLPLLAGAVAAVLAGTLATLAGLPAAGTFAVGLAVSGLLSLAFCVRSSAVHGTELIGVGLLLNAVVIMLNGAMPMSLEAAAQAGIDRAGWAQDRWHVPAHDDTRLRLLSDAVPLPLPFRPEVASVGDLLIAAGLAQLVVTAMRPRRRRRPPLATSYRRHHFAGPDPRRRPTGSRRPVPAPPAATGGKVIPELSRVGIGSSTEPTVTGEPRTTTEHPRADRSAGHPGADCGATTERTRAAGRSTAAHPASAVEAATAPDWTESVTISRRAGAGPARRELNGVRRSAPPVRPMPLATPAAQPGRDHSSGNVRLLGPRPRGGEPEEISRSGAT